MNVSNEQKVENRKKLITAAVEIMSEKGFQAATMREISSRAGLGTATIYHYFPNKEKILYAYFQDKYEEVPDLLSEIPDFTDFTLKEKLQIQLESLFDLYLEDREFVLEAYKLMFDSPLRSFSEFIPIKDSFIKTVNIFFEESINNNEIPDSAYRNFINNLYWDYTALMTLYWCNDTSTGFTNTSQIIDMTLDIIIQVLKGGIISKFADIGMFLFKNHIFSNFQNMNKLFPLKDIIKNAKNSFNRNTGNTE
ncbi:MAG: TetR/AcrR family transcriptional regulator [Spirochaetes bacterium]|nr:TetR/AcrR family transcriptional regulator [Spirochaetota bacterium]